MPSRSYTPESFAILLERYLDNRCTETELDDLMELLDHPDYSALASDLIEATINSRWEGPSLDHQLRHPALEAKLNAILETPVRRLSIRRSLRWMAAAAILLLLATGTIYFLQSGQQQQSSSSLVQTITDLAPASNKAYITLGDGKKIVLQELSVGTSIGQATKTAYGKLIYGRPSATVAYNTLTVPRGGQSQYVQLPDGTSVWLNTASSITYPTAFTEKERRVTMTGEAYFEVAKTGQTFIVETRSDAIEVLGTHFNIKAYEEEGGVQTTLLEGKVKVAGVSLSPSEQFEEGKIKRLNEKDLQRVMAWRNGFFAYDNVDVQTLMRDLGRWYDVEVAFEGKPSTQRFEGRIGRTLSLKQVLNGLSFQDINYRMEKTPEGKNRIVMLP